MRVLKVLRGVVVTALGFAAFWSVVGSAVAAAAMAFVPQAAKQGPLPEFYVTIARAGPLLFAMLGGIAGTLYALLLASVGRRMSFEDLTFPRIVSLGAAGGFTLGLGLFGLAGAYLRIWPVPYTVGVGISTLLGAGTAAVLLAWARRSPVRPLLGEVGPAPRPHHFAAAEAEVELALLERGRGNLREATPRIGEHVDRRHH